MFGLATSRFGTPHLIKLTDLCLLFILTPILSFPQCGYGIFNPWTVSTHIVPLKLLWLTESSHLPFEIIQCRCDCPVGICLDDNEQCYLPCQDTINTNPWAGCRPGWDCPWFPDKTAGWVDCLDPPLFPWETCFSHGYLVLVAVIANQKCINLTISRSTAHHRNAARLIFPVPLLVCKTAKIHMPHSRFQHGLDNGHIHQEMQPPIPEPSQAMVYVGFLTWSINWTVSGGVITRIGWQRKAMKRTTCSLTQRFVAKNGKIRTQLESSVTARIVPCISIIIYSIYNFH
jgi:hypothetical protein